LKYQHLQHTGAIDGTGLIVVDVVGNLELVKTADGLELSVMCCVGGKVGPLDVVGPIDDDGTAVVGALVGAFVVLEGVVLLLPALL